MSSETVIYTRKQKKFTMPKDPVIHISCETTMANSQGIRWHYFATLFSVSILVVANICGNKSHVTKLWDAEDIEG